MLASHPGGDKLLSGVGHFGPSVDFTFLGEHEAKATLTAISTVSTGNEFFFYTIFVALARSKAKPTISAGIDFLFLRLKITKKIIHNPRILAVYLLILIVVLNSWGNKFRFWQIFVEALEEFLNLFI